ncbi:hypothetical protein BL923_001316 [Shigella flexneri]|nr:hypothetical protein [Shigella flexneri]
MKAKSTLLLMILSVFYSHQVLSSEPTQPDVYSVVEKKLNSALPLEENTTFRSQAEWFNLQYELLVSGYPERAYNLLSKLETESKNAKYYLDLTASRVAEEEAPETALTFLSKIGLNKPATLTSFESYINSWIKSKQPEKAMQLLSLDENALNYYLPTVLVAYQIVPDKAISIYNSVYGDNVVIPYQQVTMLLTVAEGYQTKGDIKNAIHYADKALNMFDKAIAVDSSRESHYSDEYLKLMNIYAANGNKEKAVVLSQRLHKAITESQSNYLSTLEGILLFYRNNDMQQDYQNSLSNYIVFIDEIFAFSPSTRSELSLINLLNSLNEVELMRKRLAFLMTAPEYACYNSQYCYEDKVSALKILYRHHDNELMDKYFTTLLKEISNQPLEDWDIIISNTGEKFSEVGLTKYAQHLASFAEEFYIKEQKSHSESEMRGLFSSLAELYSFGNDTASANRVFHQHVPAFNTDHMIQYFINAKEWNNARELLIKEEMLGMHNLILLENICMQKNAECMAHITFTLNKLTTQPAITKIDSVGNEQLYQIGKIYHKLEIKPEPEQQVLIQSLYDRASGSASATQ